MDKENKVISMSAVGIDSPGLISKITGKIFEMRGNILDVEENCRRGMFSIFLIIDFEKSEDSLEKIIDSIKEIEKDTGLKVMTEPYDEESGGLSYKQDKENYVVTILGPDSPGIIAKISTFFYSYNINILRCEMTARGKFFSMKMNIDINRIKIIQGQTYDTSLEKMIKELKKLCDTIGQSVVVQPESNFGNMKKVIVFDLESSLIQDASIKRIMNLFNIKESSTKSLPDADERAVLLKDAHTLRGLSLEEIEKQKNAVLIKEGSLELIRILKAMGFKIAFLSSCFDCFLKDFLKAAAPEYAFSNHIKIDRNGVLTGEIEEPIMTSDNKENILKFIMNMENIKNDQVIAIGDDSDRSHFTEDAGLSIAFKTGNKPEVKTDGVFESSEVINVLYCLGLSGSEINKYL